MKKFLIAGVSLRSKGGSAMVQAACRLIGKEHKYKLLTFFPEMENEAFRSFECDVNLDFIPYTALRNRNLAFKVEGALMALDWILGSITGRKLIFSLSRYAKFMKNIDAILEINGISFSDHYGFNGAFTSFLRMKIASFAKKPYFCLPQSYGPINSSTNRNLAKHGLECTKAIFPRGMKSMDLVEKLNLFKPVVKFLPDLAFAFNNPLEECTANVLYKYNIASTEKYAAVIPNILFIRWGFSETVSYYKEIIEYFYKKYGYKFILIPHQYNDAGTDDRTFNNEIFDKIENKSCLIKIDDMLTANEIKSLISVCDFSLCSRFHGMISSLKMGVEPFVISWAEKYHEIMDLYGLIENVQDHKQIKTQIFIERIESRLNENSKDHILKVNREFEQLLNELQNEVLKRC